MTSWQDAKQERLLRGKSVALVSVCGVFFFFQGVFKGLNENLDKKEDDIHKVCKRSDTCVTESEQKITTSGVISL